MAVIHNPARELDWEFSLEPDFRKGDIGSMVIITEDFIYHSFNDYDHKHGYMVWAGTLCFIQHIIDLFNNEISVNLIPTNLVCTSDNKLVRSDNVLPYQLYAIQPDKIKKVKDIKIELELEENKDD